MRFKRGKWSTLFPTPRRTQLIRQLRQTASILDNDNQSTPSQRMCHQPSLCTRTTARSAMLRRNTPSWPISVAFWIRKRPRAKSSRFSRYAAMTKQGSSWRLFSNQAKRLRTMTKATRLSFRSSFLLPLHTFPVMLVFPHRLTINSPALSECIENHTSNVGTDDERVPQQTKNSLIQPFKVELREA